MNRGGNVIDRERAARDDRSVEDTLKPFKPLEEIEQGCIRGLVKVLRE